MDNRRAMIKAMGREEDVTHYFITNTLSESGVDELKGMRTILLQTANGNGS